MKRFWTFLRNEDGPTAVEYAVMLALIIIFCLASISALGVTSRTYWELNQSLLDSAGS